MNSKIKVFLKLYLTFKYKIITFIDKKCEYKYLENFFNFIILNTKKFVLTKILTFSENKPKKNFFSFIFIIFIFFFLH